MSGEARPPRGWLENTIILVVTLSWTAALVVSFVSPERPVPPYVHALMTLVVGAVLGVKIVRRMNGGGQ